MIEPEMAFYDLTADKPVTAENIDHAQPVASCTKVLAGVAGVPTVA